MTTQDQFTATNNGRVGILLVHGLCGSPTEVRFVANGLARSGYKVACPTLTGHGGTEEDLSNSTWMDWYASAEGALNELCETCDTVIAGGLSTGAVLALMLASKHPDKVQAVTLYSPTLWLSGRKVPWYMPLARMIDSKWFANFFRFPVPMHVGIKDTRIREFIFNAMKHGATPPSSSTPGGAVVERRRLCKLVMRQLSSIRQPVLMMHSREDDFAGLDNAAYLQRELAGPVELIVLDDCYHMITVDRQRHIVLERSQAFVQRIAVAKHAAAAAKRPVQQRSAHGFRPSVA